jgi:glycosyltransferase involved in cell wall biosynthesis
MVSKILLANKFFYLNGGSERVFFQERVFLKKKGFPVVDFSMQDHRNLESPFSDYFIEPVNYHLQSDIRARMRQAMSFVRSSDALDRLEELVQREKPDIAHLHNIYHQITPSIIPFLKKKGIKIILTLHDYKLICPSYLMINKGRTCDECLGNRFHRTLTSGCQHSLVNGFLLTTEAYYHLIKRSYDAVDLFVSPSRFLAELIGRYRISPRRITILRNGIDTESYKPTYSDKGYILYFGRLSKEKGIKTLLRAHDKICDKVPLKVIGNGPMLSDLKIKHPIAQFLGFKTGNELLHLINEASFVVVPSEWYENCSMVILEAMALGKPVIASNIGGIPEQIDDGITGFLFEMGNVKELAEKIIKLLSDKYLRICMGKEARVKLKKEFSLEKHCNDLLTIYSRILSN